MSLAPPSRCSFTTECRSQVSPLLLPSPRGAVGRGVSDMASRSRPNQQSSYSAKAGYPVRRGFSIHHYCLWNTGSPAFAGDDSWGHGFAFSPNAFFARCSFISAPSKSRAQGMPGARCARGLVCKMVEKAHTSIQVTPESPGIPHAMVYGLSRALPGVPGFLVTVACAP
jgi:hypothetical protein